VLQQVGAHEVINPEIEEGNRVAERLLSPSVLTTIPITGSYSITEVYAPGSMVGTIMKRTLLKADYDLHLLGLERDKTYIDSEGNPKSETSLFFSDQEVKIREDDILLILGANKDIHRFREEETE
jgi:trk system potassium uptake protein TrkA